MSSLVTRLRWWIDDRLPEPRQKRVAAAIAAAMIVCGGWIIVFAIGSIARASSGDVAAVVPDSPMVKTGQVITQKLRDDSRFAAVTVVPHVDYPDKLRVSGQVASPAELDALKRQLAELGTVDRFIVDVRVAK